MKRRVPFRESFSHFPKLGSEKRLKVETINGVSTVTTIDFDSTRLELGDSSFFDLENMLKSGVKPGRARLHESSAIDSVEQANAYAAAVEAAEII